jgi:hypothetical protein
MHDGPDGSDGHGDGHYSNHTSGDGEKRTAYSAGLVIYELFTGEPAFKDLTEAIENSAIFLQKPSELGVSALKGLDVWLQKLCVFAAKQRPKASQALKDFDLCGDSPGDGPGFQASCYGASTASKSISPCLPRAEVLASVTEDIE